MMYGIGIFEILLIFLVLLLFFRPTEIYGLFRKMGAWYRKFKKTEDDLRKDWDKLIDDENKEFGFDTTNQTNSEVKNDDRKQ